MLVRQVVFPVTPEELWEALTDPSAVSEWFGSRVDWDLRPGGSARFVDDEGSRRRGIIERVLPGRHLQFRWWPEEGDDEAASTVRYDLDPQEDGTRLTVVEVPGAAEPATPGDEPTPVAQAAPVAQAPATWTAWDSRLLLYWGRTQMRVYTAAARV